VEKVNTVPDAQANKWVSRLKAAVTTQKAFQGTPRFNKLVEMRGFGSSAERSFLGHQKSLVLASIFSIPLS